MCIVYWIMNYVHIQKQQTETLGMSHPLFRIEPQI